MSDCLLLPKNVHSVETESLRYPQLTRLDLFAIPPAWMTDLIHCADEESDTRILYNKEYQTVICIACKQCVSPGDGIKGHLKDYHADWPLVVGKHVIQHCSTLQLVKSEKIVQPSRVDNAIPGLALYAGWKCEACVYCCVSENNMREHNKDHHKWNTAVGIRWQSMSVQTLFSLDACMDVGASCA